MTRLGIHISGSINLRKPYSRGPIRSFPPVGFFVNHTSGPNISHLDRVNLRNPHEVINRTDRIRRAEKISKDLIDRTESVDRIKSILRRKNPYGLELIRSRPPPASAFRRNLTLRHETKKEQKIIWPDERCALFWPHFLAIVALRRGHYGNWHLGVNTYHG